ncbi:unnamed protein product [Hyaloperonospora brassicae]|uniref:RxLR effector candidate protein n=1 Tax=Hyaloperonospora brassicae TaxID=162125 RepID=A0AAV0UC40_HYABA|nr:unnamed protein product [Hyaloperonospora brassicae]
MRVYYFALVACTATLAGSTNASEPSNATMAKAELAADVRSAHGDHDGVAVKEPLEVHDHKTGEERMAPVVHASEEIEEVAHELLSAWRKSAQFEATVSRENELLSFNRDALDHYVKTQPVDKKSMHAWLEEAIRARKDPDKRGDSLKEPQEAYRAHLEALALQENLEKKSRFELHPVEVLRLIHSPIQGRW